MFLLKKIVVIIVIVIVLVIVNVTMVPGKKLIFLIFKERNRNFDSPDCKGKMKFLQKILNFETLFNN